MNSDRHFLCDPAIFDHELSFLGPTHMIEADIIIRGRDPKEPIMAHPPDTDSDITLKEWLEGVKTHNKGIKLDFKR